MALGGTALSPPLRCRLTLEAAERAKEAQQYEKLILQKEQRISTLVQTTDSLKLQLAQAEAKLQEAHKLAERTNLIRSRERKQMQDEIDRLKAEAAGGTLPASVALPAHSHSMPSMTAPSHVPSATPPAHPVARERRPPVPSPAAASDADEFEVDHNAAALLATSSSSASQLRMQFAPTQRAMSMAAAPSMSRSASAQPGVTVASMFADTRQMTSGAPAARPATATASVSAPGTESRRFSVFVTSSTTASGGGLRRPAEGLTSLGTRRG
jgi:hypothetical protein